MDMRLGIEPLHVIERKHIEKAIEACGGRVDYAAELLEIGRSTIYKKISGYANGAPPPYRERRDKRKKALDWSTVKRDTPLKHRRRVENVIEEQGGCLIEAALALNVKPQKLSNSLATWRKQNEFIVRSRASSEGITDKEVDVILRKCSVSEYASYSEFSTRTAYDMIDEACGLLGLRRYRHWLFLSKE